VLQCVAVCCSVLQCVAVCCSVLQCKSRANQTSLDLILECFDQMKLTKEKMGRAFKKIALGVHPPIVVMS